VWYLGWVFLLIAVLVGAVVVGVLAGGSLRRFDDVRLRWWPLALIGLVMQAVSLPFLGDRLREGLELWLLIGSYLPLLAFVWVNRRLPGAWLIGVGLLSNFLVISLNAGMPVTRDAIVASGQGAHIQVLVEDEDPKHHLATSDDVLVFLADAIPIPEPFGLVVSVGDLVLYLGVAWLVVGVMRGRGSAARPERSRRPGEAPGAVPPPGSPPPPAAPGATTSGT
jgi:hypothetical protein